MNNRIPLTKKQHSILKKKTITIVGVGGLGGYVCEYLARIGVGTIKLIDYDTFDSTNLNRQIVSNRNNIGQLKVFETEKRIKEINPKQKVIAINSKITNRNVFELLQDSDIVIDGLDNIKTRKFVQKACDVLNIYFIHGAINDWQIQISTIRPGSNTLNKIYRNTSTIESKTLSFIPPLAASLEASEAIKVLLNSEDTLENKLLIMDLKTNDINIIEVN